MRIGVAFLTIAFLLLALPVSAQQVSGLQTDVTFSQPSPLSTTSEIVRRMFTPVTAQHMAAAGPLGGQPVDVSKEKFLLYVPAQRPSQGYALLVFVPPWDRARLPSGWATVLDELGVIFVSASNSGNDAHVLSRRVPLALIAAYNLAQRYDVDPSRVFIGGFSGGSRVAMRLALAYPDVFRGAFLNSGGDPIGNAETPIPPADLLHKFQESVRLFYLVGDNEPGIANTASASMSAMRNWCVFGTQEAVMAHMGHDIAAPNMLEKGLTALLAPATPLPSDLASCRAGLQSRLDARLQAVRGLLAKGDKAGARKILNDLDSEFGGLAAPQSLQLDAQLQ